MTANMQPARPSGQVELEVWVRRGCALTVAAVAAYASYEHQRVFALRGGADAMSAMLWPLSVDGLLVLATVGLLKSGQHTSRRVRMAAWSSFVLGIAVSLAANIAAAPRLAWQPVLVAGWPPVALLLAVELLAHRPRSRRIETAPAVSVSEPAALVAEGETGNSSATTGETGQVITLAEVSPTTGLAGEPTAQEIMWAHYLREREHGRAPSGADLDRIAGTNNYGRTVLRQWRKQGRIPATNGHRSPRGGVA
jgi:hypothetical protein